MHVVVLSPAGIYDPGSLPQLRDDDRVSLIAWQGAVPEGVTFVPLTYRAEIHNLLTAASRSMLGRVLVRLTPLDTGVRFWRGTRSDDAAREAIRSADVLVAPERDGAYATWRWARAALRSGSNLAAVFGYPAARAMIERRAK